MYLVSFNKYFIFLQVGRPYNASGETLSSVPGNMHIRVQYCFLLITVLNSQRPPSISSCSASAYTDNLTVGMLYEILAWMANMEKKSRRVGSKGHSGLAGNGVQSSSGTAGNGTSERKVAADRLKLAWRWNEKRKRIGWIWNERWPRRWIEKWQKWREGWLRSGERGQK